MKTLRPNTPPWQLHSYAQRMRDARAIMETAEADTFMVSVNGRMGTRYDSLDDAIAAAERASKKGYGFTHKSGEFISDPIDIIYSPLGSGWKDEVNLGNWQEAEENFAKLRSI